MKTTKLLLLASTMGAAVLLSACQNTAQTASTDEALQNQKASYEKRIQALEAEKSRALAAASAANQRAQSSSTPVAATQGAGSDLFPPNAKAGHCYSRVLTPATYTQTTEKVLVKAASESISIKPAVYETGTEKVLVKEASSRLVTIPATYKTVTERVMIVPEQTKLKTVAAVYETQTERVLDKPAHTAWKRGEGFKSGALKTAIDNSTGEVMCLVEIPASYKTVTKRVLVKPESVAKVVIPAKFSTVKKRVLATPATTKEIVIPAEYKTVKVKRLVTPEQEIRKTIPASYKNVTSSVKASEEKLAWSEVLCEINMTPATVMDLQKLLKKAGTYSGPIDGAYGPMTEKAANTYAKRNNLPSGSRLIALDTAKHLGLKF